MAENRILQGQIERLLGDESLTDGIKDAPAQVLLDWGVGQLKHGQPERVVRNTLRVVARLVRDRRALSATDAQHRLQEAGLAVPATADLAAVWAEGETLADGEWAGRLAEAIARAVTHIPPSPTAAPVSSPSPAETTDTGKDTRWWKRLLFWRKAR